MEVNCCSDPAPPAAGYLATSGGLFRDCGVHDYDVVRWVTGREVVSVFATGASMPRSASCFWAATAISTSGLVKTFGPTRALDGLDLEVRTGEVHGFLGPNGAGKTTTIRILLGLLRATSGTARLLDGDPWGDAVALHRRLAYVPATSACGPACRAGRSSTCSAGSAAG